MNMAKTYKKSSGEFLLFKADEDKLDIDNINWLLDILRDNNDINVVIGGSRNVQRWNRYCPDLPLVSDSRRAMITYAEKFNEHPYTWSKSYGGGFVLKKSALGLEEIKQVLEDYPVPHYTINIFILRAVSHGGLLFTERQLSYDHYWNYIGGEEIDDHRTWARIGDPSDLSVQIKGHKQRVNYITKEITDPQVQYQFLQIEKRWAACLSAWSILSPTENYERVQSNLSKIEREYSINIYSTPTYYASMLKNIILYLVPLYTPKMNSRIEKNRYGNKPAHKVWWHCIIKRALPKSVSAKLEKEFSGVEYLFSPKFWWDRVLKKVLPKPVQGNIKKLYRKL